MAKQKQPRDPNAPSPPTNYAAKWGGLAFLFTLIGVSVYTGVFRDDLDAGKMGEMAGEYAMYALVGAAIIAWLYQEGRVRQYNESKAKTARVTTPKTSDGDIFTPDK